MTDERKYPPVTEEDRAQMRAIFADGIADVLAPLSRALLFAHAGARIPDGWDPLVLNEEEGRVFDAVEKALRDAGADFGARFPFRAGWRDNVESMAAEIMLLRLRLRDTETTPPVVAGRVVEEKPNV